MGHALRTSVGPFSAGTRVEIQDDNKDGTVAIEVKVPDPIKGDTRHNYHYEDMIFDIDKKDLVEIRNRVDSVPSVPRSARREFLQRLFKGTKAS